MAEPRRAVVALTYDCDNRCIFCAQAELDDPPPVIADVDTLAGLRRGHEELTFVGGEPTLRADLVTLIGRAAELGFSDIGLQTHGRHLAASRPVRDLIAAGLGHLHLSIHGATDAVHDYHTGVDGSLADVAATLETCEALQLDVVVTTVVTRSNFRELAQLAKWLIRRGVRAWVCAWPRAAGRAADDFHRVMPRYALAAPFVLHALQQACDAGIGVAIDRMPACVLGPMAGLRLRGARGAFASVCERCEARPHCAGLDDLYLERFESEELRPRGPVQTGASVELAPELARRFVGTGPLAMRRPSTLSPSAAQARRRLPVLAKPRPGRQEVRGRPKTAKSAAALFPDLHSSDEE